MSQTKLRSLSLCG